jgi:hypothetical protein
MRTWFGQAACALSFVICSYRSSFGRQTCPDRKPSAETSANCRSIRFVNPPIIRNDLPSRTLLASRLHEPSSSFVFELRAAMMVAWRNLGESAATLM